MKAIHYYLGSILLGSIIVAPAAVKAVPQEEGQTVREERHEEKTTTVKPSESSAQKETREETTTVKRYYDSGHKDYHPWNEDEARTYRRWRTEERHEKFSDFNKLKPEQQTEYWEWRHTHSE